MCVLRSNCVSFQLQKKMCNNFSMISLFMKKVKCYSSYCSADHVSNRPPRTKETCVVLLPTDKLAQIV